VQSTKKKIKSELISILEKELKEIENAALSSRAYAIQDDIKSEGKYDTRAIEANYMAQAQQVRVEELKLDLNMIKEIEVEHKSSQVELGSLIQVEQNGRVIWYFISSALGGTILNIDDLIVLVITVFSPIGNEALSLSVGDNFEVETPKEIKNYIIKSIS
jgi:transcription elongation GreA/GreB family factor